MCIPSDWPRFAMAAQVCAAARVHADATQPRLTEAQDMAHSAARGTR